MRSMFWVALLTFLADQVSKYYVVHWLNLAERLAIDVWPPYLNLRMAWNYGVNFGLFAEDSDLTRWVLIDRVIYGAVADFLNMSCCGFHNPFSFNIADIAVFVGAAGLVLFTSGETAQKPS